MHLENNNKIQMLKYDKQKADWMSYVTDGLIIIIIILIITIYFYIKCRRKTIRMSGSIRQESNPKEGRVTYIATPIATPSHNEPIELQELDSSRETFSFT